MIESLTLILICQLAGELVVAGTGLPLPGPVAGMAILFTGLMLRGRIPPDLERVGGALLDNLSLLFVPAGVGVMVHLSLLRSEWLPISLALVVSTLLTLLVTGWVMQRLSPRGGGTGEQP